VDGVPRLASSCAVLVLATLAALASDAAVPARVLEAGSTAVAELAGGESVAFAVGLSADGSWTIAVDQLGIDVVVEVEDASGRRVLVVDRPLDRDGGEHALLTPEAAQRYRLTLRSNVAAAPAGRVRVRVETLDRSTVEGDARWRAESAETEAAEAYARGGAAARRRALAAYRQALPHWQVAGNARRAALAVYSIAVLHRLLGEPAPALDMAQRAERRFAELAEPRWQASALNEIGLAQVSLGEPAAARSAFEAALALLADAPDPFRRAIARSNVCLTALHLGELRQGIDCYRRAAPLYRAAGDPQSEAMAATNSGRAYDILGEPDRSLESYQRALEIQRANGDASGEALTLNNLAVLHAAQGDLQRALTLYGLAADVYETLGLKTRLALALSNAGSCYWSLGERSRARALFDRSLELQRQAGDRRGEAHTLTQLGHLHEEEGAPDLARAAFEQALALRREIGDRRGEGRSLRDLGRHRLQGGNATAALDLLRPALAIAREVEDREGEAAVWLRIGEARTRQGELEGAAEALAKALGIYRSTGGTAGEASVRTALARLERRRGHLHEAHDQVAAALDLIESLRARIALLELRATYLARRREAYELEIGLLMDLHRAEPGHGYDALALAASERARARSLLDLLGESGAGLSDAGLSDDATERHGLGRELLRQRQRLLHRLDAAERARRELAARPHRPGEMAARENALEALLAELDRLDAALRTSHPAFASLVRPPVLGAGEIQRLLDPDGKTENRPQQRPETVFLVYSLGAERSFLWWVEAHTIAAYELPPAEVIETAARRVYANLSTLDPMTARDEARNAADLGRMILAPVADRLAAQRLAVVADGALHLVPFAALPDPASSGASEPLLQRHQIVSLPSASSLAVQRRLLSGRAPAPRAALVIADPVFGTDDPRLGDALATAPAPATVPTAATAELNRSTPQPGGDGFGRLAASQREARSIAALGAQREAAAAAAGQATVGDVVVATGFAANRAAVLGDALAPYRVVHFATHGLIDDRTPRLSGLVLSQIDRRGRPIDGFLRLHDVYGLSLDADLVVLSACRTGTGREIRGEGLVGLTRAFQYAGARRVLASLWRVQDLATAELMQRFYRALWIDGLEAPAALRAAQLSLSAERRWRDPYYWAGFSLHGDWRPGPEER